MVPPGCIKKINLVEVPVTNAAFYGKDDAGANGKTARDTSDFFHDYHKIFTYNVVGEGDQRREYINKNETLYNNMHFKQTKQNLEAEMRVYPDPWGSLLPTFWNSWVDQFNECYYAYPGKMVETDEVPSATDVLVDIVDLMI